MCKMYSVHTHSWASASSPMPPASAFRHPVSPYGTRELRFQNGSPYSSTGLVPESPAFNEGTSYTSTMQGIDWDTPCTFTLLVVEMDTPARPYCWRWQGYPCMSILMAVKRDTARWWWIGIHPACPYWWRWKGMHPFYMILNNHM